MTREEVDATFEVARESPGGVVPGESVDERRAAVADKVRENRLRRMAERQGLLLRKSRRRDPHAIGYQGYWLVGAEDPHPVIVGGQFGTILDTIEEHLTS